MAPIVPRFTRPAHLWDMDPLQLTQALLLSTYASFSDLCPMMVEFDDTETGKTYEAVAMDPSCPTQIDNDDRSIPPAMGEQIDAIPLFGEWLSLWWFLPPDDMALCEKYRIESTAYMFPFAHHARCCDLRRTPRFLIHTAAVYETEMKQPGAKAAVVEQALFRIMSAKRPAYRDFLLNLADKDGFTEEEVATCTERLRTLHSCCT